MTKFYKLALTGFLFLSEVALSEEFGIDKWSQRVQDCVMADKNKTPSADPLCPKVSKYLQENPLHWEGNQWFLKDEYRLRQNIKKHGLDLDVSLAPVDFVYNKTKAGEVLIVFWSWGIESKEITPNDMRAWWLGDKFPDITKPTDPGMFPVASATIYLRKKGDTTWSSQPIKTDTTIDRVQTGYRAVTKWFENMKLVTCPQTQFVFDKKNVGVCLTHYNSKIWPEIHVWRDHLASTGILVDSYLFDGKNYTLMLKEGLGTYKKVGKHTIFETRYPGEGLSDTWSEHPVQKVYSFNKTKNEYVLDNIKSETLRPKCTKLKSGEKDGVPRSPGFYKNVKTNECFEVVN